MQRKGFFSRILDLWRGFWGSKLDGAEARQAEAVYHNAIEQRVTQPLGLPRLLGIAKAEQTNIAQLSSPATRKAPFDYTEMIEAGVPGGGGVMTAATLALFYQALLHNPGGLWKSDVLADGVGNVRCTLLDPLMGLPANRTIGVVIGAGFGTTWGKSPTAFGWPGAGGQIGFEHLHASHDQEVGTMDDPGDPVDHFPRGQQRRFRQDDTEFLAAMARRQVFGAH